MRFSSFCFIRNPASPHMGVFSRTNPTAAFNYVISQIASSDVTASTQALVQFERVIRNKNHKEVSKHIDQVRCIWLAWWLYVRCQMTIGFPVCVCGNWPFIVTFVINGSTFFFANIDARELFRCCILPFPTIKAWSLSKCERSTLLVLFTAIKNGHVQLSSNPVGTTSVKICLKFVANCNLMKYTWNNSILNCGCRWKWRMIIAVNFPI